MVIKDLIFVKVFIIYYIYIYSNQIECMTSTHMQWQLKVWYDAKAVVAFVCIMHFCFNVENNLYFGIIKSRSAVNM